MSTFVSQDTNMLLGLKVNSNPHLIQQMCMYSVVQSWLHSQSRIGKVFYTLWNCVVCIVYVLHSFAYKEIPFFNLLLWRWKIFTLRAWFVWNARKCKGAVKRCMTCKHYKCYVTETYANCGLRNAHCSIYKVQIISLAFKLLIVLRSAIESVNKWTESLKMHLPHPKMLLKCKFTASSTQADPVYNKYRVIFFSGNSL